MIIKNKANLLPENLDRNSLMNLPLHKIAFFICMEIIFKTEQRSKY